MWVCYVGVLGGCVRWVCYVGVLCGGVMWVCYVGVLEDIFGPA